MKESAATANIGKWLLDAEEKVSVGDFNNVSNIEKYGIFPGQREGDSEYKIINRQACSIEKLSYNAEDYKYLYHGDGYFYGIKNDNTEVIAILEKEGLITPVIKGAGGYLFKNANGDILFRSGEVKDFTLETDGKYNKVTVSYEADGNLEYAVKVENTYTFKERCFCVDAHIKCIGIRGDIAESIITRQYLNNSLSYTKKVNMDWYYPENNDFAFKKSDALVFSEDYGDFTFITAVRDKNSSDKFEIRLVSPSYIPVYPQNDEEMDYTCHIDFAVVTESAKKNYIGLFKTKNSDFASGIAAVCENNNSTMFDGKDLHININVTNISKVQINYLTKYEIVDYYNNRIAEKTSYTNLLESGKEANHNIKMTLPYYGMYYLNYYITTSDYEYRETYPFCMLEQYEFENRDRLPFGICATHTETLGEARSTASVVGKMGLTIVRDGLCSNVAEFREFLKENGVKRCSGAGEYSKDPAGIIWAKTEDDVERVVQDVKNCAQNLEDPNFTYFFIANEVDAPAKGNYEKAHKLLCEKYIPYTYKPIYDYVSKNHPEALKKIIWQSNCHGTTEWLEAFYETGMWDNSEIIDIHSYSSPSGPDKVYSNTLMSMHADTFSNEYAMDRWKRIKKRYGEKRMMVGETGYPSAPYIGNRAEVDPRTAADFNVRIALFFLEAGCEDIIYYCLYDRTRAFIGGGSWNEMYFGALYNYDYNGVYMPKPWAAALANMTRRFDGYKKVSFFDKYEESEFGTLRAFEVEKENDSFAVLWSNAYKQPNTTAEGRMRHQERTPMPLWANRWIETETREFDAVGDTVKVVDIMGNEKILKAENGKVCIEISGSPIYVYGIC